MQEYESDIRKSRQIWLAVSSCPDFMAGYPGETEADLHATMELSDRLGLRASFSKASGLIFP